MSGDRGRSGAGAALVLAIGGGLTLAGASLATWVQRVRVDDVAGIGIEAVDRTLGVELAALPLPLGIAATALGFGLAVRREGVRRGVGAALLLVGVASLVSVGLGIVQALALEGAMATGAFTAAAAAAVVCAAGLLALRPATDAPPRLSPRYDIDGDGDDAEWDMASAEDEPEGRERR